MDEIKSKMMSELFLLITEWMMRLQASGLTPQEGHDTMVMILDQQKRILTDSFTEAKAIFEDLFE